MEKKIETMPLIPPTPGKEFAETSRKFSFSWVFPYSLSFNNM
jgi:hypothetical protein